MGRNMNRRSRTVNLQLSLAGWLVVGLCAIESRAEVVLFDGTLGTTPAAQGWPFFADPLGSNSVAQVASPGFTTLDTFNPRTDRGGYFSRDPVFGIFVHPNMPVLDRQAGYSVRFSLRIAAEARATGPTGDDNGDGLDDRAGFSMITIASDRRGLEVSFWENSIWVQNDDAQGAVNLFTQAENVPFNTVTAIRDYQLEVLGDRYRLSASAGLRRILAGRLRDYRNFTGSLDPYEIPSFLFFGDNTTRGESTTELARIAVGDVPDRCQEVDSLVARIVGGVYDAGFDLNGDGSLSLGDVDLWRAEAGEFYLGAGRTFLPGDANLDGVVDGSDFGIWNSRKFTATPAWCSGDFNADGVVDGSDFGIWNSNKFNASDLQAVPEPGASWMVLLCGIPLFSRMRSWGQIKCPFGAWPRWTRPTA